MNLKKTLAIVMVLALSVILTACGSSDSKSSQPSTNSDQSAFTWQIELRESTVTEALHSDAGVPQYDGSTLDVAFDDAPADGCSFVILTMTITKSKTGGGSFDWKNFSVVDADGNTYTRMENDSFISNHTYNRLSGTALQIGENKGSVCFEIPTKAANGALKLCYDAGDEGINTITIS